MDLLLTVREFVEAWANGDREQVLAVTTPKFRKTLNELPPSFLAQLTRQVSRGAPKSGKFHPQASIDDKTADIDTWDFIDGTGGDRVNALTYVRTTQDDPSGTPTWSDSPASRSRPST